MKLFYTVINSFCSFFSFILLVYTLCTHFSLSLFRFLRRRYDVKRTEKEKCIHRPMDLRTYIYSRIYEGVLFVCRTSISFYTKYFILIIIENVNLTYGTLSFIRPEQMRIEKLSLRQ
jgi:hypothetical protein